MAHFEGGLVGLLPVHACVVDAHGVAVLPVLVLPSTTAVLGMPLLIMRRRRRRGSRGVALAAARGTGRPTRPRTS